MKTKKNKDKVLCCYFTYYHRHDNANGTGRFNCQKEQAYFKKKKFTFKSRCHFHLN